MKKKKKPTRDNHIDDSFMMPIESPILEKFIIGQQSNCIVYYIDKRENGFVFDINTKIVGIWKNNNIKLY